VGVTANPCWYVEELSDKALEEEKKRGTWPKSGGVWAKKKPP